MPDVFSWSPDRSLLLYARDRVSFFVSGILPVFSGWFLSVKKAGVLIFPHGNSDYRFLCFCMEILYVFCRVFAHDLWLFFWQIGLIMV